MKKFVVFGVLSLSLCMTCYADGVSYLKSFLAGGVTTISADFIQTVYGAKKNQISHGTMKIQRPNKFRWEYIEDQELIISNGKIVDIYDKALEQVTEKSLSGSLGKSPALLLAGGSDITSNYILKNTGSDGTLVWVSLTPKNVNDNNGFQVINMGFSKAEPHNLVAMKFVDSFGNKSMIEFNNLKTNTVLSDTLFKFVPPSGVDIVSSLNN